MSAGVAGASVSTALKNPSNPPGVIMTINRPVASPMFWKR